MNAIDAGDTVSLNDIAAILLRRKWQIAITFFLVVGAVTTFTMLTPKLYESHMKILVKNERADMIVSAGGGDGSGYRGAKLAELDERVHALETSIARMAQPKP